MSIDVTQIIVAIIGGAVAVITAVLVPWVKSQTTAKQQTIIAALARTAVYAAQQMYDANEGKEKKDYAVQYITEQLKKYGITLDADAISAAIEAALKEIKIELSGDWNGMRITYAEELKPVEVEGVTINLDGSEVAEAVRKSISEFFENVELVKEPVSGEQVERVCHNDTPFFYT